MPQVGEKLGPYTLLKRLAVGGMGEIFLALRQTARGSIELAALKLLRRELSDDSTFVDMMIDEAKITRQLTHPNIVTCFDFGEQGGTYFLAMEYVSGVSFQVLHEELKKRGRALDLGIALHIAIELCQALAYAHSKRDERGEPLHIIHRDVTPGNVLLTINGGVKLTDFGISRAKGRLIQTEAGVIKGKLGYMAPEMLRFEKLDSRADLFCLGVLLYVMVTGQHPIEGFSFLEAIQRFEERRVPRPSTLNHAVSPALDEIMLRALEPDPGRRWSFAQELGQALRSVLATLRPRGGDGKDAERLIALIRDTVPSAFEDPVPKELLARFAPPAEPVVREAKRTAAIRDPAEEVPETLRGFSRFTADRTDPDPIDPRALAAALSRAPTQAGGPPGSVSQRPAPSRPEARAELPRIEARVEPRAQPRAEPSPEKTAIDPVDRRLLAASLSPNNPLAAKPNARTVPIAVAPSSWPPEADDATLSRSERVAADRVAADRVAADPGEAKTALDPVDPRALAASLSPRARQVLAKVPDVIQDVGYEDVPDTARAIDTGDVTGDQVSGDDTSDDNQPDLDEKTVARVVLGPGSSASDSGRPQGPRAARDEKTVPGVVMRSAASRADSVKVGPAILSADSAVIHSQPATETDGAGPPSLVVQQPKLAVGPLRIRVGPDGKPVMQDKAAAEPPPSPAPTATPRPPAVTLRQIVESPPPANLAEGPTAGAPGPPVLPDASPPGRPGLLGWLERRAATDGSRKALLGVVFCLTALIVVLLTLMFVRD